MMLSSLVIINLINLSFGMLPFPKCTDGTTATCTCKNGQPLDLSTFPPCKGKADCICPPGAALDIPKRRRACQQGRPTCPDDTPVPWGLTCEDGNNPTAVPGGPPMCTTGPLLCNSKEPLLCPDGSEPFANT